MGPECKNVSDSLPDLTPDDRKNPKAIMGALQGYFVPKHNVLHERFMFSSWSKNPRETIDEFVLRLSMLAESLEFENLKDSLIRDRHNGR